MMTDNRKDLGRILKQRRVMVPLTRGELADVAGVSPSYLFRMERGERFPSARILRKLAQPLGFSEGELFNIAGYLSSQSPTEVESEVQIVRLDPYVARVLSQEPVEMQRIVMKIVHILKSIAKSMAKENH